MSRLSQFGRYGSSRRRSAAVLMVAVVMAAQLTLADGARAVPHRAGSRASDSRYYVDPPTFNRAVEDIFFPDVREVLGKRTNTPPEASTQATAPTTNTPATETTVAGTPAASHSAAAGEGWSALITAGALEGAIKQINQQLTHALARPGNFKARESFAQVKADFAMLAVLLGVVAEYDGDVRWKDRAAAVRDAMIGANWKEATDEAYDDAKRRHGILEALLRGENLDLPEAPTVKPWAEVADRRLLMSRTESTIEQSIAPGLDAPRMTTTDRDRLSRDAQLIALAARVFQDKSYEFSDDEAYLKYAQATEAAAVELRRLIEVGVQPTAIEALDEVRTTCEACHEDYRIE